MMRSLRTWLWQRTGFSVLGIIMAPALLAFVHRGVAGGIVTALYLTWLGFVAFELRTRAQGRWTKPIPEVALVAPIGLALVAYPYVHHLESIALTDNARLVTLARLAFAGGFLLASDHVSVAFAQSEESRGRRVVVYLTTFLLLAMPPVALLVLHGRTRSVTRARGSAASSRNNPPS